MITEITSPVEVRPTKTKKPDKRTAIVEAARELFTTEGYESTTIAQVAKRAGVAVGTVYLYFKNKSELLAGVKGDWEQDFLEMMSHQDLQAFPHHLRARPLIEACFTSCVEFNETVQLMGLPPQMVGEIYHKDAGAIQEALERFYSEGVANGSFRLIDPKAAAAISYGMVQRSMEQCFRVEGGKDPARYINALVDALNHWLLTPELLQSIS